MAWKKKSKNWITINVFFLLSYWWNVKRLVSVANDQSSPVDWYPLLSIFFWFWYPKLLFTVSVTILLIYILTLSDEYAVCSCMHINISFFFFSSFSPFSMSLFLLSHFFFFWDTLLALPLSFVFSATFSSLCLWQSFGTIADE